MDNAAETLYMEKFIGMIYLCNFYLNSEFDVMN